MTKLQAGRLLTLAWFLKTRVKDSNFDMAMWGHNPKGYRIDLREHKCGTTACALGWATEVFEEFYFDSDGDFRTTLRGTIDGSCEFFGVDRFSFMPDGQDEWDYCFGSDNRSTVKQEAAIIEDFVLSKGWTYA